MWKHRLYTSSFSKEETNSGRSPKTFQGSGVYQQFCIWSLEGAVVTPKLTDTGANVGHLHDNKSHPGRLLKKWPMKILSPEMLSVIFVLFYHEIIPISIVLFYLSSVVKYLG